MTDLDEFVRNLYTTDEYLIKNPSLHEEDSPWKVKKILPLVDRFATDIDNVPISILDVGGGAGLILGAVASYLEKTHGRSVAKYALDLSPGALEIQKQRNPDLKQALHEDICATSLGDKAMDLTLLIDLLEHVPDPTRALEEVRRISRYAILKVPLDAHLVGTLWNFLKHGEPRKQSIQSLGHINVYGYGRLRRQIRRHAGHILAGSLTDTHEYFFHSPYHRGRMSRKSRLLALAAASTFRLWPRLSAAVFGDFALFLVSCD